LGKEKGGETDYLAEYQESRVKKSTKETKVSVRGGLWDERFETSEEGGG